jgi:hypothetical protein
MVLWQTAAVRIDLNVIKACMAEYFCIHVAAAIAPKVKFTAILAERDMTAVTVDNGGNFSAKHAGGAFVSYDDHGMSTNTCDEKSQYEMEGHFVSMS